MGLVKRSVSTIVQHDINTVFTFQQSYRHEEDVTREVLIGLQGRRNIMFTWVHSGIDAYSFVVRFYMTTSNLHLLTKVIIAFVTCTAIASSYGWCPSIHNI